MLSTVPFAVTLIPDETPGHTFRTQEIVLRIGDHQCCAFGHGYPPEAGSAPARQVYHEPAGS